MDPPLYEAAMRGDLRYFKTLKQEDDQLSNLHCNRTLNQETVLHIATEFHRTGLAKFVVEHCEQLLWAQNSSGDIALHIAAREGHNDMVEFFISRQPMYDIETGTWCRQTRSLNKKNDTALHCAARSGGSKCVELLVKKDSEVCTCLNNADESPLYLSIVSRFNIDPAIIFNYESLEYHTEKQNGLTELHAAVLNLKYPFDSIQKLVEWKKEMIREGDKLGMTPLHYAAFHGRNKEVELFVKKDPFAIYCLNKKDQSALYVAALNGQVNVLKELVKCHPDCYNIVDKNGRTALHAAVLGNQHRVVEYVLRTPSLARLITMVDDGGNTPLHLAAKYRFFKIIKSFKNNVKAHFALNHDSLTPFDVYHQYFYKQDIHQLGVEKYTKIVAGGYHLDSAKGIVAVRQRAHEKLQVTDLEPSCPTEERVINKLEKQMGVKTKRADFGDEESALEVNLLVAMLVATVTFAAGFTVPGGLVGDGPGEGLANLANKPMFQAFVVFNTLAFCCSVFAVLIHFATSLAHRAVRIYYKGIAAFFTATAILVMVLAFSCGTSVVLTKSTLLSKVPYCIPASFLLLYPISRKFNTWHKLRTFGRDLDVPLYVKASLFMETIKMQRRNIARSDSIISTHDQLSSCLGIPKYS